MSSYSSSKSTRALAVDFLNVFPHDSITLTYPLVTVTTKQQDLSLQLDLPAIFVMVTVAAICCIFLVKRILDYRRHVLMGTSDHRTMESDIREFGKSSWTTVNLKMNSSCVDSRHIVCIKPLYVRTDEDTT